ncbi:MAG: rubrerythrin family protein [Rhodospirillum sp.]|nr:rubrerythrin family protein [Rhodospirillum sp.]MCF8490071.1 rubrerythrin family protein [Rhodospirillum sp.]MCF8500430.1 rubrerythrin family protein [Rhodospirillum sp.]
MSAQDELMEAFSGESQANRRYLAYGEQAAKDGFEQVAKLFRAVAAAETIHALSHLRAADGVKGTSENLDDAMMGEEHEFTEMYPAMVAIAHAEGHRRAERSMSLAMEVEKVHYDLFKQAARAVRDGADLVDAPIRVCPVCGHTVIGDAPDHCPVCNAKGERYAEIS